MSDRLPDATRAERRSGPARPAPPAERPRLPGWLRVRLPGGDSYQELRHLVRDQRLHTVCEEAACPNVGECWNARELTLMILGDTCTRACGFCDVKTGRPRAIDPGEPGRVAETLAALGLQHAVITSVDRDDLEDCGASAWAETVRRVRQACPDMTLEVLVPDFKGVLALADLVLAERPHVFAHNLETVERLSPSVRPQADPDRSLSVLRHASGRGLLVKSGLMLGLGEERGEVEETMRQLAAAEVDILTLGQYLSPSKRHLPVERFVPPEEFDELRQVGLSLGLRHVEAGPLVRSSFRAGRAARALQPRRA